MCRFYVVFARQVWGNKLFIVFVMMAQSREEITWDINNYGKSINQFPPNTNTDDKVYSNVH